MTEIKYCIFCCGKPLKKKPNFLVCSCMKFKILNEDCTPEYVNAKYVDSMVYCYLCGEKLDRDEEENCINCYECLKLKINLPPNKTLNEKLEGIATETEHKEEKHAQVEGNQNLKEKEKAGASTGTLTSQNTITCKNEDAAGSAGTDATVDVHTKGLEGIKPAVNNEFQDNSNGIY